MQAERDMGCIGTQRSCGQCGLKGLAHLQRLYLANTDVADAGLAHLERLSKLQMLILSGTQVTDAGVAQLKQGLPGLGVLRRSTP